VGHREGLGANQLEQFVGRRLSRWRVGAEPPDLRLVRDLERTAVAFGKSLDVRRIAQARKLDRRRPNRIRRARSRTAPLECGLRRTTPISELAGSPAGSLSQNIRSGGSSLEGLTPFTVLGIDASADAPRVA
jgi:hypothetical protein